MAGVVGGIDDIKGAQNSLEIEQLARFAVDEHNKNQNSALEFVKVISAKEQVVAGIVYYIKLEAKDGDEKKTYEAKVFVKNFKELQAFQLVHHLGGIDDIKGGENSLELDQLARFAVEEHNKNQNSVLEFVKVISAKEQVVAGTLYYIKLEAKDSDENKTYEAKVFVKAWLKFKELQAFQLLLASSTQP